jgi:hypothetical protein
MSVEQSVEWELAGDTEVIGENLPQHKSHLTWARTRAAAVGSRRLTSWAVARPCVHDTKMLSIRSVLPFQVVRSTFFCLLSHFILHISFIYISISSSHSLSLFLQLSSFLHKKHCCLSRDVRPETTVHPSRGGRVVALVLGWASQTDMLASSWEESDVTETDSIDQKKSHIVLWNDITRQDSHRRNSFSTVQYHNNHEKLKPDLSTVEKEQNKWILGFGVHTYSRGVICYFAYVLFLVFILRLFPPAMKNGRCMRWLCCLCVCALCWSSGQVFTNVMPSEATRRAYVWISYSP